MDVLSDVLRTVRLTGSIFFTANFYEPWAILAPGQEELLKKMSSRAECISFFHIITEGRCQFDAKTSKPFSLEKDSVIIFPHSCPHVMASSLKIYPTPAIRLNVFDKAMRFSDVEYGGNGAKTQFICGYLLCDQRFNPLLGALPEMLILSRNKEKHLTENPELKPNILSVEAGSWLAITLQHLIEEVVVKAEGSRTIITRLTEMMYVEILRRYMQELPEKSRGWLAAVRDPEIGKALKLLHADPGEKWNVEELAAKVGVSRSAFARRFSELTGDSPFHYLTEWRMQLAKSLLLQPDLSMAMVAEKVGYDSDIAFNRAFKRTTGTTPGAWRDQIMGAV